MINWKKFEKEYLVITIMLCGILSIIGVIIFFSHKINVTEIQLRDEIKRYQKVFYLYKQIQQCESSKVYFKNNLLLLTKPLNIQDKILSIRPCSEEEMEAVKIRFKALTFSELLGIFKLIFKYDNLEVKKFLIKKDFTYPDLLDLEIEVKKTR